ncbi:MAG: DUF6134 family protein [Ekhidna sp.]
MRSLFTIITLFFVIGMAASQTLFYEVVRGDKKIGDMKVVRKIDKDKTLYEVESTVIFRLLFSFTVDYESTCEYKSDILINEYAHSELNGNTQNKSTIWFDGSKYTLDIDGSRIELEDKAINYSVGVVYFKEPEDNKRVFSPRFGRYLTFEKVGSHQYELESPDGSNLYTYINGICTEVKISRDFAKFYFKMKPESVLAVKNKSISSGSLIID